MFSYGLDQLVDYSSNWRLKIIRVKFSLFEVFSKCFIWFVDAKISQKITRRHRFPVFLVRQAKTLAQK